MEIHHIDPKAQKGPDTFDNGIPLCFDCHADMGAYNDAHPRGRKYRPAELRKHRDRVFRLVEEGSLTIDPDRTFDEDVALLRFFSECFDRPAFQDPDPTGRLDGGLRQGDGGHDHRDQHRRPSFA
jgi:hypothetical protein